MFLRENFSLGHWGPSSHQTIQNPSGGVCYDSRYGLYHKRTQTPVNLWTTWDLWHQAMYSPPPVLTLSISWQRGRATRHRPNDKKWGFSCGGVGTDNKGEVNGYSGTREGFVVTRPCSCVGTLALWGGWRGTCWSGVYGGRKGCLCRKEISLWMFAVSVTWFCIAVFGGFEIDFTFSLFLLRIASSTFG